uniref:Replicase polyprotein 1ab n=3 Tax=Noccaea caerulescens TaxID=107243 RepID=A0A1J3IZR9_NOCCA
MMKACNFTWPSAPPRFTTTPYPHPHTRLLRTYTSRAAPFLRVKAFQRDDFDRFADNVKSGKAWRDAWRTANEGFEQFVFEAKKTAERIDRQYAVSRRISSAASSAGDRAREIDREFGISPRVRSLSVDFGRNFPKYRKQFSDFLNTPLGGSFATIFFIWFALSGWLFRVIILATWVLPIAGPLLIGAVANNFVIKGECPACKRQFIGYKNQIIRCEGCRNIVWQPQGDFFSRDGNNNNNNKGNSKKPPKSQIIDVEFEEK